VHECSTTKHELYIVISKHALFYIKLFYAKIRSMKDLANEELPMLLEQPLSIALLRSQYSIYYEIEA